MRIISSIRLDLCGSALPPVVAAMQGDCNTRVVEACLFADAKAFVPDEECQPILRFGRADGTGGVYDTLPDGTPAFEVSQNIVTVVLTPQILAASGRVDCIIAFVTHEGNRLATFPFVLAVTPDPSAKCEESEYTNISFYLPQPAAPEVGKLLAVEEVKDGRVTKVGVTSVASTCDLAQPRWGAKVLLSVPGDPGFGYHVEMTEGEYQSLMERCKEVVVVYGDGSSHETYVAYDGDNNMGNGQCLYCYDEDGTGTLLLLRDLAPIPEYLLAGGPTVKSVNGEKPDENGNVMLFLGTEEDSPMHILAGIVCTDENHGTGVVESYQDEVFDLETVLPFAYEGRLCFCLQWVTDKLEEYVLPLTVILSNDAIETDALVFCGSIGAGRTLTVTVAPDGSFTYALTEAVGSGDLGDVSTALDHIIALQEELIGGDGT